MDDATIQKIVAEIVAHLPAYSWVPLFVQSTLTAIVLAVAVFASEYFRTRGRNLALGPIPLQDLRLDGLNQFGVGAKLFLKTFEVRPSREWTNLRRVKLEALLDKMHACEEHLEQHRSDSFGICTATQTQHRRHHG